MSQNPLGAFTGALTVWHQVKPTGIVLPCRGHCLIHNPKLYHAWSPEIETPVPQDTKTSAKLNAKLTFTNGNDSNVFTGGLNGSNNGTHNIGPPTLNYQSKHRGNQCKHQRSVHRHKLLLYCQSGKFSGNKLGNC